MVIQREDPDQVLAKCRVLYIGSSVPIETMDGLEAIQQPLRDRYPCDKTKPIQGIDAMLTVLQSGFHIQYMDEPGTIVSFPISSLTLCAAVRPVNAVNAATGEVMPKFVSLNSELAAQNAKNPAIFSAITRRLKGRRVLECHGFICRSDQDALDIVKATSFADQNKLRLIANGLSTAKVVNTAGPVSSRSSFRVVNGTGPLETTAMVNGTLQRVIIDRPVSSRDNVRLSAGENIQQIVTDVPDEFYDAPPPQGYFYRPSNVQAKTFNIEKKEPPVSARSRVSSTYVHSAETQINAPQPPSPPAEPAPVPQPPPQPQEPIPVPPPSQTTAEVPRPQVPPLNIPPSRTIPLSNGIPPPFARQPHPYPRPVGVPYYPSPPPPPPFMRPTFYRPPPPPPSAARPRFFSPPPVMRGPPYPYPYPYPMYPQFIRRRRHKRRDSESPESKSSDSRHSSLKSQRDEEETNTKRMPNGDVDSESDVLFRPRTPPRDYEINGDVPRKERLSRREEYERNRRKGDKSDRSPPRMMYTGYRPYYMYQPQSFGPYMSPQMAAFQRSRSVPPHLRYSSKDRKAEKRKQKKNKKNKHRKGGYNYPYGPEDLSIDSVSAMGGYTSEIPQGAYPMDGYYYYPPRPPRDFRKDKNQFLNEKSFSRRMQEEQRMSKGKKQDYYPTAYELNDAQADERMKDADFAMY